MLLYDEPHPDDNEIIRATEDDLTTCPDLVIVAGTRLEIPGARSIAKRFCYTTRSRGGATVWISKEKPAPNVQSLFDHILLEDCDVVAMAGVRILRQPSSSQVLTIVPELYRSA